MHENNLTPAELRRYERHIALNEIGTSGQQKLKASKVLVVGSGGLGTPVLQYLTAAGVGKLGIVDHDKVEDSNLQRQVLYGNFDIGKHKTIVIEKKLKSQNTFVNFEIHNTYFRRNVITLNIIRKYDLIIDCTDNFETRYILNDACILANKPLIYGSVYKFEGQVSVFNYQNGPSYRCMFPDAPQEKEIAMASNFGLLGTLPAIIGTIQANEALKVIVGFGQVLSGRVLHINTLNMNNYILKIKRNPENFNLDMWE